jgi:hypothetical protein
MATRRIAKFYTMLKLPGNGIRLIYFFAVFDPVHWTVDSRHGHLDTAIGSEHFAVAC